MTLLAQFGLQPCLDHHHHHPFGRLSSEAQTNTFKTINFQPKPSHNYKHNNGNNHDHNNNNNNSHTNIVTNSKLVPDMNIKKSLLLLPLS